VTVERTVSGAIRVIDKVRFDVAIVDLGWGGDPEVEPAKRSSAGWQVVHALELAADREADIPPPTIMYSMRYLNDAALAVEAVNGKTLPLPKNYTSASHQTLVAAVEYLGRTATSSTRFEQGLLTRHMKQLEAAEQRVGAHFRITQASVAVIVAVIASTAVHAVVSDTDLGPLQAAAAVLTGLFSSVLLVLHRRLMNDVVEAREAALRWTAQLRR
jgi:hypothetical protein